MTLPKFIITMDGYFRLGMVNQHKHLLETLNVPSTYRGMRIVYSYDDGFHDDVNGNHIRNAGNGR